MHCNALDGTGNEKHCTVRSNYLRTQYSTLDDYFHQAHARKTKRAQFPSAMLLGTLGILA